MPQPNPVRPGVDPQLNLAQAGLVARPGQGPPWLSMTQTLVRFLRWAFGSPTRIEFPALVDRVWTPDEASPIWISSLAEWSPAKANQRPALLDRLPQKLDQARAVLGRQFQGVRQGQYTHYMGGAHVVHCLGGRDGEAEFLAAQAFRWLAFYANQIQEALCLVRFRAVEVGKRVQLSEEHKEHYSVPIPLEYYYQENWKVYPTDESEVMGILTGLAGGP